MPPGFPPKPTAQLQRRNRSVGATTIEAPPATKVALGKWLPGQKLHPLTLKTWEVWWNSPLREEWVDADVPDLVALAALVDSFWTDDTGSRHKIHSEIRMAAREFGLTPMSRRSLQWEIKKLEADKRPAAPPRQRRSGKAVLSVLRGSG